MTGGGADVDQVVLARLADKDVVGLGEAPCSPRYSETVASMQNFLRRVDPAKLSFDDIPGSMAWLEKLAPMNYSSKCAINVALLDGAARKAGKPIYDWLGLGFSGKKHLTSFTIGIASA